jgi:hypothetical protein
MLLVVLLCLCFWCLTGDTSWGIGFFVSLGLLLTWGYRPIIYLPYIYPRKYHEQLTSFGKLSTIIDDCGILEKSDSAQVFHKWDSVIKHMEDQNGFVIFFSTQNLKYIPKRLLNGEEEKELKEELHVRQGTGVGRPKGRK